MKEKKKFVMTLSCLWLAFCLSVSTNANNNISLESLADKKQTVTTEAEQLNQAKSFNLSSQQSEEEMLGQQVSNKHKHSLEKPVSVSRLFQQEQESEQRQKDQRQQKQTAEKTQIMQLANKEEQQAAKKENNNTHSQEDSFTPTEEISEDLAVSFPTDI